MTLKGKVDNLLNAELWGNIWFKNRINLQGTIGGNLKEQGKGGFVGTPFRMGFKIKYADWDKYLLLIHF